MYEQFQSFFPEPGFGRQIYDHTDDVKKTEIESQSNRGDDDDKGLGYVTYDAFCLLRNKSVSGEDSAMQDPSVSFASLSLVFKAFHGENKSDIHLPCVKEVKL